PRRSRTPSSHPPQNPKAACSAGCSAASALSLRAALAIAAIAVVVGSPAAAQHRSRIIAEADSAYAAGDVPLADSLYFIAVRYWPRDPAARTALGRYLGAHGKTKPAIVLLEEARMFGGDP